MFYETTGTRLERFRKLIGKNDPQFVARLAVYAREQMNLRMVPLVLAVELSKVHRGDSLVGRMTERIIRRADEITELLSYYGKANDRNTNERKQLNHLSKQLQSGLQQAFNKFDEYQFAKYDRKGAVSLRDALFLTHPKAKDSAQQAIFDKIAEKRLQTPYTWETELSELGKNPFQTEEAKKAAFARKWEELIDSGKLGYMALLRNLRNILDCAVSAGHVERVCDIIASEEKVRSSKQLPFRFLSAYREVKEVGSNGSSQVMNALEKAVAVSAANIAGFDESTSVVIACDVSGSMQHPVSAKSKVMYYDIGLMLGMLLKSRCKNAVTGIFGDRWKIIELPYSCVLSNVNKLYRRAGEVGYSTNGYLVLKDLLDRKQTVDKIMIFTDCQLWNSNVPYEYFSGNSGEHLQMKDVWKAYKAFAPDARLYLFDLAGYGQTPLNIADDDVFLIAGWSDKIFDMLAAIEQGSNALAEIEKIEL
jgi:hypothetical protein